jgi:hypothetical protein
MLGKQPIVQGNAPGLKAVIVNVEAIRRASEENPEIPRLQERFFACKIDNVLEPCDLTLGFVIGPRRDPYLEDNRADEDGNDSNNDEKLEQ